jgi:hypothetical protein
MPNFLYDGPVPAYLRKPKRYTNLTISEVSSVDNGAGRQCEVVLRKREDDMQKMPHNGREPIAMTDKQELERAKRLNAALSLSKLCKQHSAGEIDGATFSNVMQGYARTEFGTGKDAMAKYVAAHHDTLSQKLKADYEDCQNEDSEKSAVGNGVGVAPSHNPYRSTVMSDSAANSDGVSAPTTGPVYNKFAHPRDTAVTVENIKELAKSHFKGDIIKAATALRRAGEEKFGSA